jgi:membrane protease YdiL (CAAX protease family)
MQPAGAVVEGALRSMLSITKGSKCRLRQDGAVATVVVHGKKGNHSTPFPNPGVSSLRQLVGHRRLDFVYREGMEQVVVPSRWRVVFSTSVFLILGAVSLAVVAPLVSKSPALWRELFTGLLAGGAVFVLTVAFVRVDRVTLRDVGAAIDRRTFQRFLFGSLIGTLVVAMWALLSETIGNVHWIRRPSLNGPSVLLAFVAYAALAGREELAFRGYPLRRLSERFGRTIAVVSVAFLFALEHRLGGASWPDALIGVGTGSIVFSVAALVTRGLAVPVGIHAAWNFGQSALGLKGSSGIWAPIGPQDRTAYLVAMVTYVMIMACVAGGFLWWERRRRVLPLA